MTQIRLRTCAVWSVFVVHMKKLCILGYPKCAQWRFWSDCANAQADPTLCWAHMSEGTCSDIAAHFCSSKAVIHCFQLVLKLFLLKQCFAASIFSTKDDTIILAYRMLSKLVSRRHIELFFFRFFLEKKYLIFLYSGKIRKKILSVCHLLNLSIEWL